MDGEVVGLRNVTLGDGSGRCCLHWKDTEISESNIRDKGLLESSRKRRKGSTGKSYGQSGSVRRHHAVNGTELIDGIHV
jgi:hypothetical protein